MRVRSLSDRAPAINGTQRAITPSPPTIAPITTVWWVYRRVTVDRYVEAIVIERASARVGSASSASLVLSSRPSPLERL